MLKVVRSKLKHLTLEPVVQRPELFERVQRYASKLSTDDIAQRLKGMTVLRIKRQAALYVRDYFFFVKALQTLYPDLEVNCCVKTVDSPAAARADILHAIEVSVLVHPHATEIAAFLKINDARLQCARCLRHKDYAEILRLTPAALHANNKKYQAVCFDKTDAGKSQQTLILDLHDIPPAPGEKRE